MLPPLTVTPGPGGRLRRRTARGGALLACALFGLGWLCAVLAAAVPLEPLVAADGMAGSPSPADVGSQTPARDAAAGSLQADGPEGKRLQLPAPPPDIAELIRRGNVAFTLYDPRRDPQEFAGLTRSDFTYRYQASSRWTVRRVGSSRELQIRPRFDQLKLESRHEVLVPEYVLSDGFFDDPLVRHELDHVRITADPRLEAMFRRWIDRDMTRLTVPLKPSQQADSQLVHEQVKLAIERVFQRVIDIAHIRYEELDRETAHGQQTLPDGFFERLRRDDPSPP